MLTALSWAGQGLTTRFVEPPRAGVLAVQVDVEDADLRKQLRSPTPPSFALQLDAGTATVTDAQPIVREGAPILTVVAIDRSGSFRPYLADAYALTEHYVDARLKDEQVGLVLFGLKAQHFDTKRTSGDISDQIDQAKKVGRSQRETRLGEFVRQAATRAQDENPQSAGGIRQVIVFTDGDEESSTWSVSDVADDAKSKGTRVHVVAFYKKSRGTLAQRLDNMSRLAAETGGTYIQVESLDGAKAAIAGIADSNRHIYRITADLCDVKPPANEVRFTEHVTVELSDGSSRLGWADAATFQQVADADATDPCLPPGACASDADCTGDETCDNGTCTAPSNPIIPAIPTPQGGGFAWGHLCASLVIITLLGMLLLAVGAVWASRREADRDDDDERTLSRRPPPNPPGAGPSKAQPKGRAPQRQTVIAEPPKAPTAPSQKEDFPPNLPETHLVVVSGDRPYGERWRFAGRILRVGALEGEDNDVVVNLPQLSGHHARFELFPSGSVFVTDLGSSNGTWVDGRRLDSGERAEVQVGMRVALSKQLVVVLEQPVERGDA